MNWNNLQNRMQEDASQKEAKVDIDEIWAAIEPEVDVINQERRKKGFPLFWMLGLALVLTVGGLYYMFDNNTISDNDLVEFEKMERHTEEHSHVHHDEVEDQLTVEESIQKELNRLENPNFELTQIDATEEIMNSDIETESLTTKKEKAVTNKVNQVIGSTKKNKITKDKLPWKISQSNQKFSPTNVLVDSDLILSNVGNKKSNSTAQVDKNVGIKELVVISKLSMLNLSLPVIKMDKGILPTNNISNYYTALTTEEIKEILSSKKKKQQQYGQPKFTFSLGLMGGIGSAPNTLTSKDSTTSPLLLIRRETESSLETSQYGLSFSLRHESGIQLSTGVQQTTFAEKVAFSDNVTTVEQVPGITDIIIDSNGDSTFITGLITQTTVSTFEKKHYVRYKLLEVPLIVGWQTKDKMETGWTFGVEAGVVPNLTLKTTGSIFKEDYSTVDIETNQEEYFKKNIGLSYHVGFSVRRMLGENIELSLKPTVRFFPKDFSADGNTISQKYNLVSGQVGVNYIFGN